MCGFLGNRQTRHTSAFRTETHEHSHNAQESHSLFRKERRCCILLVGSYVHVFRKPNEAESGGSPLRAGVWSRYDRGSEFHLALLAAGPFQPTMSSKYSRPRVVSNLAASLLTYVMSWITKVCTSYGASGTIKKMTHHHQGAHNFFSFTMHTNILRIFFAPNCRF